MNSRIPTIILNAFLVLTFNNTVSSPHLRSAGPVLPFFTDSVPARPGSSFNATKTSVSIDINGLLDESEWKRPEVITGFLQFEPAEGAAASKPTEVRVLFGENSLFIGVVLYDEPDAIEKALGRRDEYNRADWFLVSIDSYFNRRNAFTFGVSAAGVQLDGQRTGSNIMGDDPEESSSTPDLPSGLDISWDAIWYSAVNTTADGWVVEMRIPYSMLRFPEADNQTWGMHFTRRMARLGEVAEWPLIPRTERINLVSRFGLINNITGIEPRRNMQIRPYVLASLNSRENESKPGTASYSNKFDLGGDLKIGLGPNVMLDMTINPDFGQIEADPAVLNLTAFETIYPEKRPFFIEGVDIFQFSLGPGSMFYSRRIGANDPIIGAVKVSGRTAGGLSFGLLGASTGENFNPARNYAITRVSQQLGSYSSLGGIASMLLHSGSAENSDLRSFTGGIDWDLRNKSNTYGIAGIAAFSHRDTKLPDAEPATGYTARVELSKRQGTINGVFALLAFSDKFYANDIGRLQASNFYEVMNRINYEIKGGQPFWIFQRAKAGIFMLQRYSYDDLLDLGDMINIESEWTTDNFSVIRFGSEMDKVFSGYDIYETRGLGPWASPSTIGLYAEYNTDQRRNWKLAPGVAYEMAGDKGRKTTLILLGNWNIGNRLALSGSITSEMENSIPAWASNESFLLQDGVWHIGSRSVNPSLLTTDEFIPFDDGGELNPILGKMTPYDTDKYFVPVFGERNTRSFDLTIRSSFSFNPDLSLQFYSQFFLARGVYERSQILVTPDEPATFDHYPKKLDFSYKSLVSNLVLRWEYRPGSTIYAVWSHGRKGSDYVNPLAPHGDSHYDSSFGSQVNEMFDIFPENAFIVKLSYTFL